MISWHWRFAASEFNWRPSQDISYPSCLLSTLAWTWLCISNSLAMNAGSSECYECPTTPLFVVDIVVVVMAMTAAYSGLNHGWFFSFNWIFFLEYKILHSRKYPLRNEGDSFGSSIFEERVSERRFCHIRSEAVPVGFRGPKIVLWNGTSTLTPTSELSEVTRP